MSVATEVPHGSHPLRTCTPCCPPRLARCLSLRVICETRSFLGLILQVGLGVLKGAFPQMCNCGVSRPHERGARRSGSGGSERQSWHLLLELSLVSRNVRPRKTAPPPPVCPSTSPLLGTCREPGHAGAEPPRVTGQPQQGLHLCLAFCEFRIQRLPADNETELWSPAEGPGHPEAGCFRKGEEGGVPGRGRLGPEASPACASSHPEAGMGTSRGAPPGAHLPLLRVGSSPPAPPLSLLKCPQ